ncbi:MAG: 1-acyl-sn-glycerol-3-phosphate acyltransferase [Gammaproteobacteria bacterium]|nr:1-acyl-sn-glycerol-3-phosphate acyltransferase [Gammaproteobacteria bacterium]MCP5201719.1 1-acyl-sn-glycerol-3-phosphate acyltransferase [Gammaproteobacteria bacterium]
MTRLRSWLFYLGLTPLTVLFSFIGILILPLPRPWRYAVITRWSVLTIAWLKLCCGLGWSVRGREHIPATPGVILCKHQSAWETITLQLIFPRQCQVLKRELLRVPFFGWGLASLNPIAIDRKAGARALKVVLAKGVERLRDGWWVLLFPEGTRIPPGERGRYTQTGAALAREAGCPVIPVAHNAGVFWGRNAVLKYPGTIEVVIGPPIDTAGKSAKAITREAEAWIEKTCAELPLQAGTRS